MIVDDQIRFISFNLIWMKRARKKRDPGYSETGSILYIPTKTEAHSRWNLEENRQDHNEKATSNNTLRVMPTSCVISESDTGLRSENMETRFTETTTAMHNSSESLFNPAIPLQPASQLNLRSSVNTTYDQQVCLFQILYIPK